jgi:hypothetical protein
MNEVFFHCGFRKKRGSPTALQSGPANGAASVLFQNDGL